ncbi:putative quinol monooxygenase [Ensifer aridi]|uniref:putative quinol monooxygenase n=1 Tax=Ensifer aridi TaxID=1708715 RepID=UPI000A0F8EFE|nr:putative quinol monooxygenase [Ensifer aridi]
MTRPQTDGYVVVVEFLVRGDFLNQFREAVMENAATSLRDEPGCSVFDVCQVSEQPERIHLYEVYGSRADFDFHLKSAHFLSFSDASQPWVLEKEVQTFERIAASSGGH